MLSGVYVIVILRGFSETEIEPNRPTERERDTDTERERQRQRDRDIERQRHRETDTDRQIQTERDYRRPSVRRGLRSCDATG